MKLPDEAIKEFQDIYEQEFGEKLAWEDAELIASRLLALYKIIAKPIPENKNETPSYIE
ncbi:MAG: hypothetical protein H6696_14965 [Deferribacteres bacterium]|nr:hypothetical protein [candidate division KSB1 bacterium]MCB9503229.1 hypothetical protein [Deferribacteres bacterium]